MRWTHFATTVLAVGLTASLAFAGTLDTAMEAFAAGNWDDARVAAAAVPTKDPAYARAQYVVGECLLQQGEWDDAEKAFRAALSKKPEAVPVLVGLGVALTRGERLEDAEEPLKKAVKLEAKDAAANRALGEWHAASGDLKSAKKTLSAAWKLDTKDARTARALVDVQLKLAQSKGARATAKKLTSTRPKHPMGPFLMGWALDHDGDVDDAIAAYQKSLKLDETFLDAHKNLAILGVAQSNTYARRDRVDMAMTHFKRYFALGGDDPELKSSYSTIHRFLKEAGVIGDEVEEPDGE